MEGKKDMLNQEKQAVMATLFPGYLAGQFANAGKGDAAFEKFAQIDLGPALAGLNR